MATEVNIIQIEVEENNQLIETSSNLSRSLEVYDSEIKTQKRGFEEDEPGYKVKCVQCRKYSWKNICNCIKQKHENQRILNNFEEFLYRLGKNRGQAIIKYMFNSKEQTKTETKIQILVCITMYNKYIDMLQRTLKGIQENLPEFEKKRILSEQIEVIEIKDGVTKTNNKISQNIYGDIDKYLDLNDQDDSKKRGQNPQKVKDGYQEQGLDGDIIYIQPKYFSLLDAYTQPPAQPYKRCILDYYLDLESDPTV